MLNLTPEFVNYCARLLFYAAEKDQGDFVWSCGYVYDLYKGKKNMWRQLILIYDPSHRTSEYDGQDKIHNNLA